MKKLSLCCCHTLFFPKLQDRKGFVNFISLLTAILMPAHEQVIAFYYVTAADIFDTVTIARHLAGRLLAPLFTTLTSYIILPTQYCHIPRQFLKRSNQIWSRPDVFHPSTKDIAFF